MQQRARLVVAIQSAHGVPVEGAEIELRPPTGEEPRALARTNDAGRTTADDLTPGSYELLVSRRLGQPDAEKRTVYLDAGRNTVSLKLRGDRRPPVEDAR
jgi:hypothetical protein